MKKLSIIILLSFGGHAFGQANYTTSPEEKFQDVFTTAGYSTAFGAALGAASLSFYSEPQEHLMNIAVGASLGFISGSIFGSYVVFSPMVTSIDHGIENQSLARVALGNPVRLIGAFNKDTKSFDGLMSQFTIATF